MQEQKASKVTLYLPPDLHRQLKIRSAIEGEAMSAMAERAIGFYLSNAEVVDEASVHGQSHRVYTCPNCSTPSVVRDGNLVSAAEAAGGDGEEDFLVGSAADGRQSGEEPLLVC